MRLFKKPKKRIFRFKVEATIDVIAASEKHGQRRVRSFIHYGELRKAFLVKNTGVTLIKDKPMVLW